mgnify:CR=1 FL=1
MAELTQTELEDKIATIDTKIATITAALANGTGATTYVDYTLGPLSVSGSQQLQQLRELRSMYQDLLGVVPKEVVDVVSHDIGVDGEDTSDLLGDE